MAVDGDRDRVLLVCQGAERERETHAAGIGRAFAPREAASFEGRPARRPTRPSSTAMKASFSSGSSNACSPTPSRASSAAGSTRRRGTGDRRRRAAPSSRGEREAAAAARTVRARAATPSASAGEAVTVANARPSRTSGFASITAATCDELTVACACVRPPGGGRSSAAFQTTSGASRLGERAHRKARRRRHRRGEDDGVGSGRSKDGVGAVAVGVGVEHPGVDDVELARRAARRSRGPDASRSWRNPGGICSSKSGK